MFAVVDVTRMVYVHAFCVRSACLLVFVQPRVCFHVVRVALARRKNEALF